MSLESEFSISPNSPIFIGNKIMVRLYCTGVFLGPGTQYSLVGQYNHNYAILYPSNVTRVGDYPIGEFWKHSVAHIRIYPENDWQDDEQLLLILKLKTGEPSRVQVFVGGELVHDESNILGDENIAILFDKPEDSIINVFLRPYSNTLLFAFKGADGYII